MKHTTSVFRFQLALFTSDKGIIIFYLICIIIAGIAVPFFTRNLATSLNIAAIFTVMFLNPVLAESLAGEREKKTLESLLSTSINGKSIVWGKILFSVLFAVLLFGAAVACIGLTYGLAGYETGFAAWQWVSVIFTAMLSFTAISFAGTYASATSPDIRTANSKIARSAYPLGLLLTIFLAVVSLNQPMPTLIVGIVIAAIYLCTSIIFVARISAMKQSRFLENIAITKTPTAQESYISYAAPSSQFSIVFRHELKYILQYKMLLLNLLYLCFCPAAIIFISKYYLDTVNLNYAVLLTALLMPRAPTNLIALSIGGEKAYKTGESLLATPLRVRPIFLAKSMIPILVSAIMLAVSSLLTLATANIIGYWYEAGTIYLYSAAQIVLLFPVGVLSCVAMVFITGILAVNMKTPRQGLYASSILGMLFVIPPLLIVNLAKDVLLWAVIYSVILLLGIALCLKRITDKISHPQLMSKL